jgi:hypothetical protein
MDHIAGLHYHRYQTRTFVVSTFLLPPQEAQNNLSFGGRDTALISRTGYVPPFYPLPRGPLHTPSTPRSSQQTTGEYVFDFAVVILGVCLLLPRACAADPFTKTCYSARAPLSGDARRDSARNHVCACTSTPILTTISLSHHVICVLPGFLLSSTSALRLIYQSCSQVHADIL